MQFFVRDPGLEQVGDWWQKMWTVSQKIGLWFDLYSSQVLNLWRIETGIGGGSEYVTSNCMYVFSPLGKQIANLDVQMLHISVALTEDPETAMWHSKDEKWS